MLAKQYRLQKDKDLKLVFKNGKAFSAGFLFLKLKKNNLQVSRFGFIVGKRISKKAAIRNKIKRRLREIIRKNLDNIKSEFDIVIWVKPVIADKNYQEIEQDIKELLKKSRLIK